MRDGYQSVKTIGMRRALVLTDESAGHPFRASLPPSWRFDSEVEQRVPWREQLKLEREDMKEFAATYCAFFIAATAFFY